MTSEDAIKNRIKVGMAFTEPWARRAVRNANRYLGRVDEEASEQSWDASYRDLVEGEVNPVAINIRQTVAATCISLPDFDVEADDPDAAEIVRNDLKGEFTRMNIERLGRRMEMMRRVQGMAWLRYFWTEHGFTVEVVKPRDFFCDPHATDMTWENLRWAGCRVYLPLTEAIERYGMSALGADKQDLDEWEAEHMDGVEVILYWDEETEAEVVSSINRDDPGEPTVVRRENPYKRVPMVALLGDPDPISEFPLSNYETSGGPASLHRNLQAVVNEQARNGGGLLWVNATYLDADTVERIADGEQEGPVITKGVPGQDVIGYTPNQALNPTVMEALANVQRGIDMDMAISGLDLGQPTGARTATENTYLASRSSARGISWRKEFERFLSRLAEAVVHCKVLFGMDPRIPTETPELWMAYRSVRAVWCMEESTAWRDPMLLMQSEMQLLSAAMQMFQASVTLGKPINMLAIFEDLLRAHNKKNIGRYFMSPEETQAFMQMQAQQAQAAAAGQQGPRRSPVETLNYKDAPPDVKRQIEAQAGLQPSQEPEMTPQDHQLMMEELKHHTAAQQMAVDVAAQQAQQQHEAQLAQQEQAARLLEAAHAASNRNGGSYAGR